MLKVYWFKVYYGSRAHVNVQFAPDLEQAYAQERRASIELPRRMNARYPRQPQPVATRILAMQPPSRSFLMHLDAPFCRYLDEAARLLDHEPVPSEPSGSVVPRSSVQPAR